MLQRMLLAAISLPILLSSMAIADWARDDPHSGAERNRVQLRARVIGSSARGDTPGPTRHQRRDPAAEYALRQACQEMGERLARRLPADHSVVVHAPFVLAGNISASSLRNSYRRIVAPAITALTHTYFRRTPDQPVTLLLLKDEQSYREIAHRLFGQQDVSIYGYYKPSTRTIVINMAAGDGTVVHELTHALVDFDFPGMPIWLNEGMASLYEQCLMDIDENGARIVSQLNWRLSILHDAMADGELKSITSLARCTHFRGADEAIKYAHARYFCMFLEHQGLLDDYYHAFRANQHRDPHGIETLSAMFDHQPFEQIDRAFQSWAFGLQLASR